MTTASIDHGVGLQHLAFNVPNRVVVEQAHQWAVGRGSEVVHEPRAFPEHGEHAYATSFMDLHGIMIEVVSHAPAARGLSGR